jgi:hypothetical protein
MLQQPHRLTATIAGFNAAKVHRRPPSPTSRNHERPNQQTAGEEACADANQHQAAAATLLMGWWAAVGLRSDLVCGRSARPMIRGRLVATAFVLIGPIIHRLIHRVVTIKLAVIPSHCPLLFS